jgi:hypothetical protein
MRSFIKITLALLIPILIISCDSSDEKKMDGPPPGFDLGQIYKYDITECLCCGGYMITIENEDYRFDDSEITGNNPLPSRDKIKYPVYVYIKWSFKNECGRRINVKALRLATSL